MTAVTKVTEIFTILTTNAIVAVFANLSFSEVFSSPLFFAFFHRIYIRVFVPKSNGNRLCKGIDPARDSVRFWCISPAIAQRSKLLLRFRSHRHSAYFYGRCAVPQSFQGEGARFLFGRSRRFGEPCRDSIVKAKKAVTQTAQKAGRHFSFSHSSC